MHVEISYGPCADKCGHLHVYAVWRDPISTCWIRERMDVCPENLASGYSALAMIAEVAAGAPRLRRMLDALPLGLMVDGNDLTH